MLILLISVFFPRVIFSENKIMMTWWASSKYGLRERMKENYPKLVTKKKTRGGGSRGTEGGEEGGRGKCGDPDQ